MKLLLDQGIPRSAAALLRADGLDAVHTGEVGMATAEDADLVPSCRSSMTGCDCDASAKV